MGDGVKPSLAGRLPIKGTVGRREHRVSRSAAMADNQVTCQRRGRQLDLERIDRDGWLVLDARGDGRMLVVCAGCQTPAERQRVQDLA